MRNYLDLYKDYEVYEGQDPVLNLSGITRAINDALGSRRPIELPYGELEFAGTIPWDCRVSMRGAGWQNTILKSTTAAPLLQYNSGLYDRCGVLEDFGLDGNNVGTIGMDVNLFARFTFRNIWIENFTQFCAKGQGLLIGTWENVRFFNSAAGVDFGVQQAAQFQSNFVTYRDCYWEGIKGCCLHYDTADSILLERCDIEGNGSASNKVPMISMTNSAAGDGEGLIIRDCYFERNVASAIIDADGVTTIETSEFKPMSADAGVRNRGILFLDKTNLIGSGAFDVLTDGSIAKTNVENSFIRSHNEVNNGIYNLQLVA